MTSRSIYVLKNRSLEPAVETLTADRNELPSEKELAVGRKSKRQIRMNFLQKKS